MAMPRRGHGRRLIWCPLQASEGRAVPLEVRREGRLEHLSVTPRRWAGAGLLGMHLRPL
jgi:hypothetical protein